MPLGSFSPLFRKKALILTHAGADVDAIGAAAAIKFSLKSRAEISICVPEHMNLNAKALAKKLSIPYSFKADFSQFDCVLSLDFNKSKMLGPLAHEFLAFRGEKFLVDHHSKEAEKIAPEKNSLADKNAVSTTELVYALLKKTRGIKIPKKAFACIAAGIITDSASFHIADHKTFSIMAEVMEKSGMRYSSLAELFRVETDFSQKVAALKAAKRARIFKAGDAIIALSEVGAFEADSANALVRIGATIAFCGYAENGKTRLSGRVNNYWMNANNFDLARDIFNPLEEFFDGEGGGHAGASGFNGTGKSIAPLLLKCAELSLGFIKKSQKNAVLKEYT